MSHACIQSIHLVLVHLYESLLRGYVLIWFLIQEKSFHEVEETVGVEGEEPFEELLICGKPHNIVDIDTPLE